MKVQLDKLTRSKGERPELIVNGTMVADEDGKSVIRYDIPVDTFLDAIGTVKSKADKELQGVSLQFKPVEFDHEVATKDAAGADTLSEVRFVCEPTWRGTWTSLKVSEILNSIKVTA